MVLQSGDITSTQTLTLRSTELDIGSGNSNGPLWIYRPSTEERIIYGVVSNSTSLSDVPAYNEFTRITSTRFSDLQNWISEDDDIRPPTDRPDLVDYDDWFDTSFASFSDSEVEVGDTLRLRSVVRNNGTATAGEFTVSFYASTDTFINGFGDYLIGSTTVSSLEPFTWADAIWEGDLPDIPAGEYYIGWEIDSFNTVFEFDGDNNTGIITSDRLEVLDPFIIAPVNDNFNQASLIRGTPGSFRFDGTNSDSPPDAINLDIDGNGETDALTDGVAAMRYLFQFSGDVLIDSVIGVGATRTTALEITNYLNMARETMLDVDGNGMADALTDGIMMMRYLFGFGGNAVIDEALGPDATRTTAAAIIDHLQFFDIGF
ncbi:MAG: hypothetical protein GDA48_24730 [Hormoscilla sp. GM102CHS1]|nr:hypothetical protein [Hormoscilla sp. GM102CHS1]